MKVLSLVTLAIALAAVFAMLDQDSGIAIWRELRRDLETSNTRVEQLVRENEALRGEIAILESEPAALDRAIREELDLVLPGEVVVRFEPSGAPEPPSESSASPAPAPIPLPGTLAGRAGDRSFDGSGSPSEHADAGRSGARDAGESL